MERETRKNFFAGSGHTDVINKINHIIHFSNMAIALDGATGSGKSTLINQVNLKGNADFTTRFSLLDPAGPDYVIERIVETWSIDVDPMSSISERFNAIYRTLQGVKESNGHINIIIDNADLLDDDAVEMLVNLKTSARENTTLIMTGVDLSTRLKNMDVGEPVMSIFSFETIPAFTDEEATDFMLQRYPSLASLETKKLKQAMGKGPFYPEDVKRIGAELLHSTDTIVPTSRISAPTRASDPASASITGPFKKHLPVIGGVALAAVVGTSVLYAFSGNSETSTEKQSVSLEEVRQKSKQSIENLRKGDIQTIEKERELNSRLLTDIQAAQSEIDKLRQDKEKLELEMRKAIQALDYKENVIKEQEIALADAERKTVSKTIETKAKEATESLLDKRIEMAREANIESKVTIESMRENKPSSTPVVSKIEVKPSVAKVTKSEEAPKSLNEMRSQSKVSKTSSSVASVNTPDARPSIAEPTQVEEIEPNPQERIAEVKFSNPVQVKEQSQPMSVAKEVPLPITPVTKKPETASTSGKLGKYVIQLVAHKSESAAQKWIKKRGGDSNLHIAKSKKGGTTYYAVVYGGYDSKSEANADVGNVKSKLNVKDTWVRSSSGLN